MSQWVEGNFNNLLTIRDRGLKFFVCALHKITVPLNNFQLKLFRGFFGIQNIFVEPELG